MSRPRTLPRAKRSLGQNFLVNQGVRDKIIDALDLASGDCVVEIGPGPGALTTVLTERCARVIAIELDHDLAAALPQRVAHPAVLEVRLADAATLDYVALAAEVGPPLRVVGNLPFNAGAAILRRALEAGNALERLVLMFQREVAQRLIAAPGSKDYGLLSVVTQQRAEVTRLFDVAPGSFHPAPRVAASVVHLQPQSRLPDCCLAVHDRLLRAAFANRRKTLRNNFRSGAPWPWSQLQDMLGQLGISAERRAESVPVGSWAALAALLCHAGGAPQ